MCSTDPYAVPILLVTVVTILSGVGIGGALVGSGLEKNCNLLINSWKFVETKFEFLLLDPVNSVYDIFVH